MKFNKVWILPGVKHEDGCEEWLDGAEFQVNCEEGQINPWLLVGEDVPLKMNMIIPWKKFSERRKLREGKG